MNIAEQIKSQRLKKNLTQQQLGDILNVSRSTISSWEVDRNYPDLETIIAISDLFEISLDELLRGDKKMLEKITDDTKIRKLQTKKIKLLIISLFFLIIACMFLFYKSTYRQEIQKNNQIESIEMMNDGQISIKTILPFYRSVEGTSSYPSLDNPDTMIIDISTKIDLSLKHDETAKIRPYNFPHLKQVKILDKNGKAIKTLNIK